MKDDLISREQQIQIIERLASKDVLSELLYYRDELYRDEPEEGELPYDLRTAYDDVWDLMDGNPDFMRSFVNNMRDIAIAIGQYREVTEEELARTISTGKKYAWKHRGKKYEFNRNYT